MTALTIIRPFAWLNALLFNQTKTRKMPSLRLSTSLAIAALLGAGVCGGGEIYKWTDENGNVHYEDRPVANADLERVDIVSRKTDNSAVQARVSADREAREADEEEASEDPPEMTRKERYAEQQAREDRCEEYRQQLDEMMGARRLYKDDGAGGREYLDDEQILEARSKVEAKIAENCG